MPGDTGQGGAAPARQGLGPELLLEFRPVEQADAVFVGPHQSRKAPILKVLVSVVRDYNFIIFLRGDTPSYGVLLWQLLCETHSEVTGMVWDVQELRAPAAGLHA